MDRLGSVHSVQVVELAERQLEDRQPIVLLELKLPLPQDSLRLGRSESYSALRQGLD